MIRRRILSGVREERYVRVFSEGDKFIIEVWDTKRPEGNPRSFEEPKSVGVTDAVAKSIMNADMEIAQLPGIDVNKVLDNTTTRNVIWKPRDVVSELPPPIIPSDFESFSGGAD